MLRHRPKASSAAGILPEGCLMALYVLENQGFPPAPLLRVAPLPGHCAPKCWAIFQQLALSTGMHTSLCPTFVSVIVMLLSAYSHTGSSEFFPQPYLGSLIATVKLFYNRFCYQEWIFYFIITQILIIHSRHFFITSDLLCCLSVVALLYTLKFNICCIFWVCSITPLPVLSPPVYIFRIYFKMLKALQACSVKVCFFCVCCFLPNGKFLTLVVYSAELCGMLIWGWRHFLKQI